MGADVRTGSSVAGQTSLREHVADWLFLDGDRGVVAAGIVVAFVVLQTVVYRTVGPFVPPGEQ